MGLFDGLIAKVEGAVTSAESRAAGLVTSAEQMVGMATPAILKPALAPALSAINGVVANYASDTTSWAHEITRWDNILSSLDGSMNAKDGASDLSAQYRAWKAGPCATALSQIAALQNGHTDYNSAQSAYQAAVSQATALQKAIQDRWAQASAGPTVADYVKAPYTAVVDAAQKAETALAPALNSSAMLLQYGPWILGGLAVMYLSSFLPKARRD